MVCRYSVRFQRQEKHARLTMIKDDIQLLYEYDRWANGRVLQAASALSPEQFTRDLGGSFVSVRDTLVHIIRSEWGWLTYWKSTSHSAAFLQDLWDEDNPLFRLGAFPDVTAVARKWAEVEKEQTEFVNSVTEEALRRTLPVLEKQLNLAHLMQHLANHSTYHRGQIASAVGCRAPAHRFRLLSAGTLLRVRKRQLNFRGCVYSRKPLRDFRPAGLSPD